MMPNIYIIQNTVYHFETTVSLYAVLQQLNLPVSLYRCVGVKKKNLFQQQEFLYRYGIHESDIGSIDENGIGFVVSAYPSAFTKDRIPSDNDIIFSKLKKLVYICHRFGNPQDYLSTNTINSSNAICLSPLAAKIDIDYIYLTHSPVAPNICPLDNGLRLTTQGHFEQKNRNKDLLNQLIDILGRKGGILNIVGTNAKQWLGNIADHIHYYESISECNFYDICNNMTHFLLPTIDMHTKYQTYIRDRYSSNFNLAYILEKPIFAHEIFQKIYRTPGIYYNDKNFRSKLNQLLNIQNLEYLDLVKQFSKHKKYLLEHNAHIIHQKINNLIS